MADAADTDGGPMPAGRSFSIGFAPGGRSGTV